MSPQAWKKFSVHEKGTAVEAIIGRGFKKSCEDIRYMQCLQNTINRILDAIVWHEMVHRPRKAAEPPSVTIEAKTAPNSSQPEPENSLHDTVTALNAIRKKFFVHKLSSNPASVKRFFQELSEGRGSSIEFSSRRASGGHHVASCVMKNPDNTIEVVSKRSLNHARLNLAQKIIEYLDGIRPDLNLDSSHRMQTETGSTLSKPAVKSKPLVKPLPAIKPAIAKVMDGKPPLLALYAVLQNEFGIRAPSRTIKVKQSYENGRNWYTGVFQSNLVPGGPIMSEPTTKVADCRNDLARKVIEHLITMKSESDDDEDEVDEGNELFNMSAAEADVYASSSLFPDDHYDDSRFLLSADEEDDDEVETSETDSEEEDEEEEDDDNESDDSDAEEVEDGERLQDACDEIESFSKQPSHVEGPSLSFTDEEMAFMIRTGKTHEDVIAMRSAEESKKSVKRTRDNGAAAKEKVIDDGADVKDGDVVEAASPNDSDVEVGTRIDAAESENQISSDGDEVSADGEPVGMDHDAATLADSSGVAADAMDDGTSGDGKTGDGSCLDPEATAVLAKESNVSTESPPKSKSPSAMRILFAQLRSRMGVQSPKEFLNIRRVAANGYVATFTIPETQPEVVITGEVCTGRIGARNSVSEIVLKYLRTEGKHLGHRTDESKSSTRRMVLCNTGRYQDLTSTSRIVLSASPLGQDVRNLDNRFASRSSCNRVGAPMSLQGALLLQTDGTQMMGLNHWCSRRRHRFRRVSFPMQVQGLRALRTLCRR